MDFFACIANRTRAKRKEYEEIFENGGDPSASGSKKQHKSTERSIPTGHHNKINHGINDSGNESDGEIRVASENYYNKVHSHASEDEFAISGESVRYDDDYTTESEDEIEVVGETKGINREKQLEDDENETIDAKGCEATDITSSSEQESDEEEDENEIIDAKGCEAVDIASSSEQESEEEEEGNANCDIKNDAIERNRNFNRKNETDASLTENTNPSSRHYILQSFVPATTGNASETPFKNGKQKETSDMESDASFDSSNESSATDTEYDDSDDEDFDIQSHDTSVSTELTNSYEEEVDEEHSVSVDVSEEKINDSGNKDGTVYANASARINSDDTMNEENNSCKHDSKKRKFSSRDSHIGIDAPLEPFKEDSVNRTYKAYGETKERIEKLSDTKANGEKPLEDGAREEAEGPPNSTNIKQVDPPKASSNELYRKRRSRPGISRLKQLFPPTWSHSDELHKFCNADSKSDHKLLNDVANREKHGEGETSVNENGHSNLKSQLISDSSINSGEEYHSKSGVQHREKKLRRKDVETKPLTKTRRRRRAQNYDIHRILVDSILQNEDMLEKTATDQKSERSSASEDPLPLKFRLKDEEPKPAEKSEYEDMVDGLFSDLRIAQTYDEMGSFESPAVDNENDIAPEAEEHPSVLCFKGKHHLVLHEEIGLRCLYCPHVELERKYIPPLWSRKTRSEWKKSASKEQFSMMDGLNFETSSNDTRCSSNKTTGAIWDIIPGVGSKLFQHQQEGFEFLWKNLAGTIDLSKLESIDSSRVGGCIISHAPGTGKSRLTIVFLESYLKLFPDSRPVIIAPASMLLTWEQEFRKWEVEFPFHNLNNLEFSGKENKGARELLSKSKSQNKDEVRLVKMFSWNKEKSVLGISYSLYEKLAGEKSIKEKGCKKQQRTALDEKSEEMRKILLEMPGLVVLDEGHTPRNQRSLIWNTLLKLQTQKRIILSGTPFQNNFGELFNTLRLVRPAIADVLGKEKTFSDIMSRGKFSRKQYKEEGASLPSSRATLLDNAIQKLKATIEPFVHAHKGKILQQSLPGLIDSLVLLNPPPLQKFLIEKMECSQNTFEFEHKVALISTHPYLLKYCGLSDNQKDGVSQDALENSRLDPEKGVKTRFIMELIRLSMALEEKVLIFSQYIHPLGLIKDQLQALFNWDEGKQVLQMQGRLDQKQRLSLINVFNDPGSEAKVMLASTKCCSEGISLIGASRVVLLDVVWNPSVERQAISRAYRLGQTKVVYTYHLMTSGTTEAAKYCRQAEKDRLSELVFSSTVKEVDKQKHHADSFDDRILGEMVDHAKLQDMFEKVIYQPKQTNLMEDFSLVSSS